MGDLRKLSSVHAVLDRARWHLKVEDLPHLVMSDPGTGGYLRAYERVLRDGVPALLDRYEGGRLLDSFDISENLLLSHSHAEKSPRHRWFSVLGACIELLRWGGLYLDELSGSLAHLLTDSFALAVSDARHAPLELLPELCRELQRTGDDPRLHAVATLCELLVASLEDAEVESRCGALAAYHEELQVYCDEEGNPNPWRAPRPEFLWGALVRRRSDLRGWLALVEAHFPSTPARAEETRARLLREGREWRRKPR